VDQCCLSSLSDGFGSFKQSARKRLGSTAMTVNATARAAIQPVLGVRGIGEAVRLSSFGSIARTRLTFDRLGLFSMRTANFAASLLSAGNSACPVCSL